MQTGWARPSGAMSHQPRAERPQRGSVTLGGESTPNGRPWRGQKPIPFAFCFCSYRAQSMRGGLPRVSAHFAHLAPGLVAVAPLGRIHPDGFVQHSTLTFHRSPLTSEPLKTSEPLNLRTSYLRLITEHHLGVLNVHFPAHLA